MVRIRILPVMVFALTLLAWASTALAQQDIRVVLSDSGSKATIAGNVDWFTADGSAGSSNGLANIELTGGQVSLSATGARGKSTRMIARPVSGYIRFSGREYRGDFEFFPGKSGGLVVLNVLPLEDYLLGVVPGEMPASWPEEALKSQAVAARTYAISRMTANQDSTYDVYSTVSDQVYSGVQGEDPRTTAAVQATAGIVITYEGQPITAYYSADAGGYTKEGSLPYLQPVPSFDPESPHSSWEIHLSNAELTQIASGMWQGIGKLTRVDAAYDQRSGHLDTLLLTGEQGRVKLNPANLRKQIGYDKMKSTRAQVFAEGAESADAHVSNPTLSNTPQAVTEVYDPAAFVPDEIDLVGTTLQAIGEITTGVYEIFDYERPYIQTADGPAEQKMRRRFAFNGTDLKVCDTAFVATDMSVILAEQQEVPAGGGATTSTGQSRAPFEDTHGTAETINDTHIELNGRGIVIRGSGYGHGVGMSQWGARKLAADGLSYIQILQYFYSGVALTNWSGDLVTVTPTDDSPFYDPFIRVQ